MPRPKHVVWLTTDHMRFDGIAAHGLNPLMHTPNLDRLVNHGVSFSNCFTQHSACMPSRASFMTGLYPPQTGVTDNGIAMPHHIPTAASMFRPGNYHTAHIGKMHLEPHDGHAWEAKPRHNYGFDAFWWTETLSSADDMYQRWLRATYPEYVREFFPSREQAQANPARQRVVDAPIEASHSGCIADLYGRYMGLRGWHPQFMHLGFFAPHPPLVPTREAFEPYANAEIPAPDMERQEWLDKPGRMARLLQQNRKWTAQEFVEYRRYFYALVTEVDHAVGRIIQMLEKRGDLDDTLLVFTSDHGDMCGDHRLTVKREHFLDEVMHVPLVLHWPAGLGTDGRRVDGLVELMDMLPTCLDLADLPLPEHLMGHSYAAALREGSPIDGRDDVFAYHGHGYGMLRSRTHKYVRFGNDAEVLFDLAAAPREVTNVAADPAHRDALNDMRRRMVHRALDACRSPLPRYAPW